MEQISLFTEIKNRLKKYLKWYSYPFIYFLITGIVCLYAWYHRPIPQRRGIEIVFKTIAVIPTLIWVAVVTLWLFVIILLALASCWLKRAFPDTRFWSRFDRFWESGTDASIRKSPDKRPKSLWKKAVNVSAYAIGTILVTVGVLLAIWISRPYIAILLSSSRVEALEQEVRMGEVRDNRIIIPSVLVDAPIMEGVDMGNLSRGVCHVSNSPAPGQGGNCIIEGHNLAEFGWWKPQSFFSVLEVVGKGTPIYVFYNGKKYTYKVKEKTYKSVNDSKLYDMTPGERLTLLTCVSTWSPTIYTNRRTVIVAYPES